MLKSLFVFAFIQILSAVFMDKSFAEEKKYNEVNYYNLMMWQAKKSNSLNLKDASLEYIAITDHDRYRAAEKNEFAMHRLVSKAEIEFQGAIDDWDLEQRYLMLVQAKLGAYDFKTGLFPPLKIKKNRINYVNKGKIISSWPKNKVFPNDFEVFLDKDVRIPVTNLGYEASEILSVTASRSGGNLPAIIEFTLKQGLETGDVKIVIERATVFTSPTRNLILAEAYFHEGDKAYSSKAEVQKLAAKKALEKAELLRILTTMPESVGPQKTDAGVYYKIIKSMNGSKRDVHTEYKVNIIGKLANGKRFLVEDDYSISEGFCDYDFNSQRGYCGLFPALGLMSEGDIYEFTLPSKLAFGDNEYLFKIFMPDDEPDILTITPPNAVIIYEVELLEIF